MSLSTIPDAAEFGLFRSDMARMKGADNRPIWKQADIDAAVGGHVSGKTWGLYRDQLLGFLKTAPKDTP